LRNVTVTVTDCHEECAITSRAAGKALTFKLEILNFSAILHDTQSAPSMPQEPKIIPDLIGVHGLAAK
jgi:hypothetical protein